MRFHALAIMFGAVALSGAAGCNILTPPPAETSWTDERRMAVMGTSPPAYIPELSPPPGLMEEIRVTATELERIREQTRLRAAQTAEDVPLPDEFASEARRRAQPPPRQP